MEKNPGDHLVDRIRQRFKETLTAEELELLNALNTSDQKSFERQNMMQTLSILTEQKARQVVHELESESYWKTNLNPSEEDKTKLNRQILAHTLKEHLADYFHRKDIQRILSSYSYLTLTPEDLEADLYKFLGRMQEQKVKAIMKELGEKAFWPGVDEWKDYEQVAIDEFDKDLISNYKKDFESVPECNDKSWPSSKQLLYCQIQAKLSHPMTLYQLGPKHFQKPLSLSELHGEILKLKRIVKAEGRMTPDLTSYFERAISYQEGQQVELIRKISVELSAIKKELMPIDINDLTRLYDKIKLVSKQIQGKDILLFIGDTGSGKTTTIKALLGYQMGWRTWKGVKYITIVEPVSDKIVLEMKSNPGCDSNTRTIVAVKPIEKMTSKDIYLTDTPGFGDTRGKQEEIINQVAICTALNNCRSVIPVIVISAESWGSRGNNFRNLSRNISSLFNDYEKCRESVVMLFNRFSQNDIRELPLRLNNLIESSQRPTDFVDPNFIAFLKHAREFSSANRLISFDPVRDSASKTLQKILSTQPLVNNSRNLFRKQVALAESVKIYSEDVTKKFDYHLKRGNYLVVNHLIAEIRRFQLIAQDRQMNQQVRGMEENLKESLKNALDQVEIEFNDKISSINDEDIRIYVERTKEFQIYLRNGLVDTINLQARILRQVRTLSDKIRGASNESVAKNKELETVKMLGLQLGRPEITEAYQTLITQLRGQEQSLGEIYVREIEQREYSNAAATYQKMKKFVEYQQIVSSNPPLGFRRAEYLLSHVKDIVAACQRTFEASFEEMDVTALKQYDNAISKLQATSLISDQQQEYQPKILLEIQNLKTLIKMTNERMNTEIITILDKAKELPPSNEASETLKKLLSRQKELGEISILEGLSKQIQARIENKLREDILKPQRCCLANQKLLQSLERETFRAETVKRSMDLLAFIDYLKVDRITEEAVQLLDCTKSFFKFQLQSLEASLKEVSGFLSYDFFRAKEIQRMFSMSTGLQEIYHVVQQMEDSQRASDVAIQLSQIIAQELGLTIQSIISVFKSESIDGGKWKKLKRVEQLLPLFEEAQRNAKFRGLPLDENGIVSFFEELKKLLDSSINSFTAHFQSTGEGARVEREGKQDLLEKIASQSSAISLRAKEAFLVERFITTECEAIAKMGGVDSRISQEISYTAKKFVEDLERYLVRQPSNRLIEQLEIQLAKFEVIQGDWGDILPYKKEQFDQTFAKLRQKLTGLRTDRLRGEIYTYLATQKYDKFKAITGQEGERKKIAKEVLIRYSETLANQKRSRLVQIQSKESNYSSAEACVHQISLISEILSIHPEIYLACLSTTKAQYVKALQDIKKDVVEILSSVMRQGMLAKSEFLIQQVKKIETLCSEYDDKPVFDGLTDAFQRLLTQVQNGLMKEFTNLEEIKLFNRYFQSEATSNSPKTNHLQNIWWGKLRGRVRLDINQLGTIKRMKEFSNAAGHLEEVASILPVEDQADVKKKIAELEQQLNSKLENRKRLLQTIKEKFETQPVYEICSDMTKQDLEAVYELQESVIESMRVRIASLANQTPKTLKCVDFIRKEAVHYISTLNHYEFFQKSLDKVRMELLNSLLNESSAFLAKIEKLLEKLERSEGEEAHFRLQLKSMLEELFQGKQALKEDPNELLRSFQEAMGRDYEKAVRKVVGKFNEAATSINFKKLFSQHLQNSYPAFRIIHCLEPCIQFFKTQLNPPFISEDLRKEISPIITSPIIPFKSLPEQFMEKIDDIVGGLEGLKLSGDDRNFEEHAFAQKINKFKNSCRLLTEHKKTVKLLRNVEVQVEKYEKSFREQVNTIFNEMVRNTKNLKKIDCPDVLSTLNRNFVKLRSVEQAGFRFEQSTEGFEQGFQKQLKEQAGKVMVRLEAAKEIYTKNEEQTSQLRQQQDQQTKEAYERLEEASRKKVESLKMENTKLNRGAQEQVRIELAKIDQELTQDKLNSREEIQKSFEKIQQNIDRECTESLKQVASSMIMFKTIQMNLNVGASECAEVLRAITDKISKYGRRYANILAHELDAIGGSYAVEIIKQSSIFGSYKVKLFRHRIKYSGKYYVLENTHADFKNSRLQMLNTTSQNFRNDKDKLLLLLEEYDKFYKAWINKHKLGRERDLLQQIKEAIKIQARKVKQGYDSEKRGYDQKRYQNSPPIEGHKLMALIAALWTISNASETEKGLEYLYELHPAQLVAISLLLGIPSNNLSNRLAEVLTGEGKSVVLAMVGCYLGLIGYKIHWVCYSSLLSKRDAQDFAFFFKQLGLSSQIEYGTYEDLMQRNYANTSSSHYYEDINVMLFGEPQKDRIDQQRISEVNQPRVLLIDEMDVFFSQQFFGEKSSYCRTLDCDEIQALADFVWEDKATITYERIVNSNEFKALIRKYPRIEELLRYEALNILEGIQNYEHDYVVSENKIGYERPEGINYYQRSWSTTFAYYHEVSKGVIKARPQSNALINITDLVFSYAQLPKPEVYDLILGVSGTLKSLPECQRQILSKQYKIKEYFYIPSVYGPRVRLAKKVSITDDIDHHKTITEAISKVAMERPVLVYFDKIQSMKKFFQCQEYPQELRERTSKLSETNNEHEIKRIINFTTRFGQITLATKSFGRGIDFVVVEKEVKDKGGLHVIQTFISKEQSESIQIEGRTARQGESGSFELIVNKTELQNLGLNPMKLGGLRPEDALREIGKAQNKQFSASYEQNIAQAVKLKQTHEQSLLLMNYVRDRKVNRVMEILNKRNKRILPTV